MPAPTVQTPKQLVKDALVRQGFLPIYVHDQFDSKTLVSGAIEAGCKVLEYTCRRHDAREMIPWIKREYPEVAVLGATMIDGPRCSGFLSRKYDHFVSIDEMVDLGVDGLVSFMRFLPETYEKYRDQLVIVPGAGTANEAMDQLELGADFIKFTTGRPSGEDLFMSSRVGAHHLLPIMCSGGVTPERAAKFVQHGAVLCSAGYDLILKDHMETPGSVTPSLVAERVGAYISTIADARQKHQSAFYQALVSGEPNPMRVGPWLC